MVDGQWPNPGEGLADPRAKTGESHAQCDSPWPDVPECYGPHRDGSMCAQCDGSHEHRWVEGEPGSMRVPVRCTTCGARKCDVGECWERRHHRGPHVSVVDGSVRAVGR